MLNGFDLGRLFDLIAAERERLGLSWSSLSDQVGVSASTIRRFATADDAEADGVLVLLRWLAVVPEQLIVGGDVDGRPLPVGGIVRVDMELVAAANNDQSGAKARTRTTIQRLVETAQRSRQPVAALTRISDT